MSDKLEVMFKMQKKANDLTNGLGWVDGLTDTEKEINWLRCLRFELVEAIDQSTNWKHWKNITGTKQYSFVKSKDFDGLHNLKIELIDGWHFLMSEIISQKWENETIKLIKELNIKNNKHLEGKELVMALESLERIVFVYEDDNTFDNLMKIVRMFWEITLGLITLDEVYTIYVLKNTLNIFRQENGYKDGSYIKEWGSNKIEDNVFLDSYIKDNGLIEYDIIYSYLTTTYKELNG